MGPQWAKRMLFTDDLLLGGDARGHLARSREEFRKQVIEKGVKEAVRQRDEPFGDGIVRS